LDRCEYDRVIVWIAVMTTSRPTSKQARGAPSALQQEPIDHSLYYGRERLGRYLQIDRKRFRAFDALDRPLGNFRVRARALKAIRKAWARQA
jgi:hypothetical protein